MLTETLMVPALAPEAGDALSQLPPETVLAVAVQLSVPPPELETLMD